MSASTTRVAPFGHLLTEFRNSLGTSPAARPASEGRSGSGMRDREKPKRCLPAHAEKTPDESGARVDRVYAAFFLVVSFFAEVFPTIGFGLLEPSPFALAALGFFGANTCSASVSKSGWLS
jgi:hypothetical protein